MKKINEMDKQKNEILVKIAHDYVLIRRDDNIVQIPIHEVIDVIHPAISRFIENNPKHIENSSYVIKPFRKVVIVEDFNIAKSFDKPDMKEYYFKDAKTEKFERVSEIVYNKYIKETENE